MKSITQKERKIFSFFYFDISEKEQIYIDIALSIFMWNGHNFLVDRGSHFPEIVDFIKDIPSVLFDKMVKEYQILALRYMTTARDLVGYSLLQASRTAWCARRGACMNAPNFTGIEGTGSLPLNDIQETWCLYNHLADVKGLDDVAWNNIKQVLVHLNPKNSRNIQNADRQRQKAQEDLKKKYIDEAPVETEGNIVRVKQSDEELIRQLQRAKRGEKDLHDLIVEKSERELLERLRAENTRVQSVRLVSSEADLPVDSESKPISVEEMQRRIQRRKAQILSQAQSTMLPVDEDRLDKNLKMSQLSEADRAEIKRLLDTTNNFTSNLPRGKPRGFNLKPQGYQQTNRR